MLTPDRPAPSTVDDLDTASLLDGLFEQLRLRPSETALLDQDGAWSYNEVFRAAASVAHALIALEGPEAPTCLVVADRSRRSVAAAFGALMAGRSYCLVDRGYPSEKLQPVIGRLQPGVVVDCDPGAPCKAWPAATGLPTLYIDDLIGHREKLTASVTDDEIDSWSARLGRGTDVAFYTFTSGTTGIPKVLAMSHTAYSDVVQRLIVDYEFSASDRIAVQSGFMFDAIWDVLTALNSGGAAVILPDVLYEDGRAWARFLRHHRVTSLMTVPAALQYALETMPRGQSMPPFRQIILTADRISRHVLDLINLNLPPDVALHNCYGVAEAPYLLTGRVDPTRPETASLFDFPDAKRVEHRLEPLDQTLVSEHTDRSQLFALNQHSATPQNSSASGRDERSNDIMHKKANIGYRLQVRGGCVFSGYLQDAADDTSAIIAPLSEDGFYDTGDIFRIVPHQIDMERQALRLVGRMDRRISWLGHRIEPEEIEIAAEAIPGVDQAIASITADGRLICTVYGNVSKAALRDFHPIPAIPPGTIKIEVQSKTYSTRKIR